MSSRQFTKEDISSQSTSKCAVAIHCHHCNSSPLQQELKHYHILLTPISSGTFSSSCLQLATRITVLSFTQLVLFLGNVMVPYCIQSPHSLGQCKIFRTRWPQSILSRFIQCFLSLKHILHSPATASSLTFSEPTFLFLSYPNISHTISFVPLYMVIFYLLFETQCKYPIFCEGFFISECSQFFNFVVLLYIVHKLLYLTFELSFSLLKL